MRWISLAALAWATLGCAAKELPPLEGLPEASLEERSDTPREQLEQAAASLDSLDRGRALALLVRGTDPPVAYVRRGLEDPDPHVQRQAAEAALGRLDDAAVAQELGAYVTRSRGDPYARGRVALVLVQDGAAPEGLGEAWRVETEAWRVAPLALAAAVAGDQEAVERLEQVLATGRLPFEKRFFDDIGGSGLTELLPALEQGQEAALEEAVVGFAVARLALGDRGVMRLLRGRLMGAEVYPAMDVLDRLVELQPPTVPRPATRLLRRASRRAAPPVRQGAMLERVARGDASEERVLQAMDVDESLVRVIAMKVIPRAWDGASPEARAHLRAALRRGLEDPRGAVRVAALRAWAEVGLDEERARVEALRGDHAPRVRLEAAGALLGWEP